MTLDASAVEPTRSVNTNVAVTDEDMSAAPQQSPMGTRCLTLPSQGLTTPAHTTRGREPEPLARRPSHVTTRAKLGLGAIALVVLAGVLSLFGQWSAGLEVLVVAIVLAVVAWRRS